MYKKSVSIVMIFSIIICIAIPLIVGIISSFLTKDAQMSFNQMNKPPLSPPGWLFPIVWTILYIVMGIASYLIMTSTDESKFYGIILYFSQLVFNFMWSIIFFRVHAYWFAAIWLALLIMLIVALMVNTLKYSMPAMFMLLPYLLWCCFAMYLNIGIAVRN